MPWPMQLPGVAVNQSIPPAAPLFLSCASGPVFVTLHQPEGAPRTAVLLCPPFGWDEVCSYRPLRRWAESLAATGHPALRLSLPGTGDSGGHPRDANLLEAWVRSVDDAAAWLRDSSGASRVAVVGIGLGGLVACLALSGGTPIDDLVLWATPARGKTFVREFRAFSRFERERYGGSRPAADPRPEDGLEAGGFTLSAETLAALDAVDLRSLDLPTAPNRRVLLLERDGMPVDAALRERLAATGAAVTVMPGDGLAEMTSHPQGAVPPTAVIQRVADWLGDAPPTDPGPGPGDAVRVIESAAAATIPWDGIEDAVRETIVSIPERFGSMSGMISEPTGASGERLCVVLLNAGATRRVGLHRMWVEAARRWAIQGIPTLRLDVEAIGDADGDETPYQDDGAFYTDGFVGQVRSALDFLQSRGLGSRFVLGGLCSGAFWSFHLALEDPRVRGVMLLNPRALIWTTELGPRRDLRAALTQRPSLRRLRRAATPSRLGAVARWLALAPRRAIGRLSPAKAGQATSSRALEHDLDRLVSSGCRMLLLFSEREPVEGELERAGLLARLADAPNVSLEHVPVVDHTMRAGWAQDQVHRALDRVVEQERDRAAGAAEPPLAVGPD